MIAAGCDGCTRRNGYDFSVVTIYKLPSTDIYGSESGIKDLDPFRLCVGTCLICIPFVSNMKNTG